MWYYTQYQNVDKKTKWDISSNKVEYTTTDRHGEFTFKGDIYPLYQVDITASIVQFGRTISKTCRVTVKRPIISEKIILNSHSYEDMNGQSYIYMKLGENNPYEVKVSNYSPFGVVTNPGIEMMVVDEMNVPSDQFVLSGHNVSAKIDADPGDYYLIIFARDALKVVPSIEHGGYDHPEDFIMEGIGAGEENQYKNAFFRLKISLADGSEEHPYLIHTAEDFKNIEGEYHYKLMNNINISSLENFSGISEFYGHILTEGEVRTIGGITLNNARPNLIGIFGGTMSNIMFQAELGYVNYSGNNTYLGVIGRNVGTLTNVYANITGSAIADSEVYLGGLVGLNTIDQDTGVSGKISYDDTTRVGVNVRVKLAGNIYFGGLVGLNETTIEGVEKEVDNPTDINFGISLGDQGALANIHITTETALKSIGGVVGKNKGSLSDAYVTGIITAESTDNVGGAIGINEYYVGQDTIKVQLLKDSISSIELASGCEYKVNNISSTVRLSADENVGGIIGYNNSAVITECHYQVVPTILELNTSNKSVAITGNNKVGGIVGYTKNGLISYSSVYSYWWDYTKLGDITDKKYDISGTTNVAGLVGLAESENDDILASKDYDKLSAIIYSSVNGYIAGHGLANNDGYELAIFNAYSMGSTQIELKGNINRNVYLKNSVNSNVSANGVINSDAGNILSGEIPYFGDSTLTHWGDKNTLNGGYIYVSRDDDAVLSDNDPLFEVAPTEITAEVKDDYRIDTSLDKLLVLNYYDFNSSDIDIEVLNELNNSYNTHDILEYVRLGYPLDLGGVRLYVESEDPSIASIQSAGKIRINGTGRTKLTFISVLNPAIRAEIDVIVVTPIGDYEVSDNLNDPYMDSLSIAKDKSKMLYSYTSGIKPYLREDYAYTTNTKPYLDIAISGPAGVVISDYLAISGNKEFANNIQLANTLPFTITVLNIFEGAQFSFVVKPYTLLTYKGIPCKIYSSIYEEDNEYDEFDLTIGNGATGISLNYSGALLYPADRTIITAYLETDMPLFGTTDYTGAKEKLLKSIKVGDTDVSKMINVVAIGALDNGVRPIIFELVIDENVLNFSQGMSTIELILKAGENEDITASAVFDVLPQRIEKIDIKNYARDNLTSPWELTDMIKPASTTDPNGSLLMIDMVPINAYFDYLEIRDITGSELIKFIQVKNEDLEALDIKYTDDGLGIRLEPQGMDTIYVHMQIESSYTTKVHTLEVTAYVNGSDSIVYNLYQETKQVEAKMLPEIKPTYVLPNGDEKIIENGGSIYLACGTDAELRILVEDATEPMTHTLTYADGTELVDYEFVHDQGLFYILKYVGNPANRANLMGKTITLTLTAVSEEENGEFEEITYVISFVLVEYQIHSISVSPSMNNEIYGLFNRSVDLSFYLAATDISYYGRLAANTEYRHTDDRTHVGTGSVLESIYNILDTLNSTAQEPSQLVSSNENIAELAISNERLTLKVSKEKRDSNGVLISQYTGEEYLTLTLPLELDADGKKWVIARGTALYTIGEEYGLNFIDPSSKKEPIIITSEKEFIEMASGPNTYYALGKDLEFDDYVPLNVNVTEFDGNGHIITIRGFMDSESADVKLGVFAEIPKGMLVKNLTVYYPEDSIGRISGSGSNISISYKDLTDNEVVNYSTVNFGGLAGVNNGIITNCNVQGTIAIHASVLETRGTAMNIGGLVATNTSTGYITHSNTELNIYSQSNIGGLVYENAGTIASSYNKNAKIYAYNKNLTSSIIVQVAGFVAKNSGDISMSYIKLDRDHVMRAKDVSGGFVLTNTGTIVDSYSEIDEISYTTNSNYFSGFVDNNSGTIERAYTYINAGNREDNNLFMFIRTGQNSGELIDCIEIVNSANYSSTEEGLDNVKYSESRTKFIDKGYSFGNNLNMNSGAVWAFEFGLPRLSSTKEVVKPIVDPDGEGMEYVGRYIIYQKVVVETEDGEETKYVEYNSNYGSKDNPFVIHDINSWNEYMMDYAIGGVNTNYFRIVSDIDFSSEKDNPKTSTLTFAGNIQGNNMTLSNIILKSNESLSSIGLFETMESRDGIVDTQVRNMTLNASSVWATKTQTVGILAGVIENFDLYNINIDAENITIVGGNAVGGLAGIVRGSFDIDKISSNVGVNSTRVVATNQHHIYSSVNNQGEKSNNIANVYYAGSVAGILDGYDSYIDFDISSARIIDEVDRRINNYYQARNISVSGSMVLIGDIVGSAFGLIGERVQIDNVKTALNNASLTGSQYSSGLVGENRGVIVRSSAKLVGDHSYDLATGSMAGLVGLNLGGLVHSSSFEGNIINNQRKAVVGGIVGRNINGTIFDVNVSGNLAGHFLGGIVGADYTKDTLVAHGSGYGALVNTCKGDSLIPSDVEYKESNSGLNKFVDLKISSGTLEYMLKNIKSYYTYRIDTSENGGNPTHTLVQTRHKVLGLAIGMSDITGQINSIAKQDGSIVLNKGENWVSAEGIYVEVSAVDGLLAIDGSEKDNIDLVSNDQVNKNILSQLSSADLSPVYQVYLTGTIVSTFDSWAGLYSKEDMLILGNLTIKTPTPPAS
ncbi:MAG: hypothetical protein IKC49_02010 [Clostridia bacterium]|nr:hypothetical protein [Clostridia bacterium]